MNDAVRQRKARWELGDIVDLERYPISDLSAPEGRTLVQRCRAQFVDSVICELPGFVRPDAIDTVVADVESITHHAYLSARWRSAYGFYGPRHGKVPEALAEDDPHARPHWRQVYYLAYDEFSAESVLHRLYQTDELTIFAAAVLDEPAIFRVDDRLMAAPVSIHTEGCELGWHCDTQEFSITIMFRPSTAGGIFQYLPLVGPDEANYEHVPAVFDGDMTHVRSVPLQPGSLVLFRGANTLHRVTPTKGKTGRILSIFHLERTPGRIFQDQFKLDVFGRVA